MVQHSRFIAICFCLCLTACQSSPKTDVPISPESPAAGILRKALLKGESLQESEKLEECRKLYDNRSIEAIGLLGGNSEVGEILQSGIDGAKDQFHIEHAIDSMEQTMKVGLFVLEFEPILEAPTPKGYPKATPVDEIRLKTIPVHRAAMAVGRGRTAMFTDLFDHLRKNELHLTAPIRHEYDNGLKLVSLAFFYGDSKLGQPGQQGLIAVKDQGESQVVSIGLRGPYNDDSLMAAVAKLKAWIEKSEYKRAGRIRRMTYNSPRVPEFLQFSEVEIPVARK